MSISDFYVEYGLGPEDDVCAVLWEQEEDYGYDGSSAEYLQGTAPGFMAVPSMPVHFVLNEQELDYMAETYGWEKMLGSSIMAAYRDTTRGMRLHFWLTTGTVGSYLDHPHQGKTQLFRRSIDMARAAELFRNPRQHTGVGYHRKGEKGAPHRRQAGQSSRKHQASGGSRLCASCKCTKSTSWFSKNQLRKGSAARCKSCVG